MSGYDEVKISKDRTIFKASILCEDSSRHDLDDDKLTKLGFVKLASLAYPEGIWFHTEHWTVTNATKYDYWVGEYKFKAKTKIAERWADDFPIVDL